MNSLKEDLAEYAHEAWIGWIKFMWSQAYRRDVFIGGEIQKCIVIPEDCVKRWERQMKTKYKDLSESEKNSDRLEANKILRVIDTRNNLWKTIDKIK